MKTFEKLRLHLEKNLGIKATNFRCLKTGRVQKANSAWSWTAQNDRNFIGSQWPAKELLKSKELDIMSDGSIFPNTKYKKQ